MLLQVTDANATPQTVVTQAQEAITVLDGTIAAANVSKTITVGVPTRSGWLFQNTSSANLWVEDVNSSAAVGKGYQVFPGQIISTAAGIPNSANAIQVIGGTAGQTFTFRQW